jgi:hypothetical protein
MLLGEDTAGASTVGFQRIADSLEIEGTGQRVPVVEFIYCYTPLADGSQPLFWPFILARPFGSPGKSERKPCRKELTMKKLLIGMFVIVFIAVIAGAGALYYVKPDRALDLSYEEVPLEDRALSMAKRLSLQMSLTAEDLNNLAKKSIADNPQVEEDVLVTGADFTLNGDKLIADLNVIWKDRVSAGIQVTYRLRWEDPNVVAAVEKATMKGITLSNAWFSDRTIPIGDNLPSMLRIKSVEWDQDEVKVIFRPAL